MKLNKVTAGFKQKQNLVWRSQELILNKREKN